MLVNSNSRIRRVLTVPDEMVKGSRNGSRISRSVNVLRVTVMGVSWVDPLSRDSNSPDPCPGHDETPR